MSGFAVTRSSSFFSLLGRTGDGKHENQERAARAYLTGYITELPFGKEGEACMDASIWRAARWSAGPA